MDILYIYNGWKNSESLRYSMRSVAKNGKHVGNVYLVSAEKPEWLSDKVTHIKYESNPMLYKENDITAAIYAAVDGSNIKDRFLIFGDDYMYIKPTDFDKYPIYRKDTYLPTAKAGHENMGGWKYVQSLVNTRILLQAAGLPYENYCEHAAFYGDRNLMWRYRHIFDAALFMEFGVVYDSVLGNLIVADGGKNNPRVVDRKDNKIENALDLADLQRQIGDTEVFSTARRVLDGSMLEILKGLFPDKCKYEK